MIWILVALAGVVVFWTWMGWLVRRGHDVFAPAVPSIDAYERARAAARRLELQFKAMVPAFARAAAAASELAPYLEQIATLEYDERPLLELEPDAREA